MGYNINQSPLYKLSSKRRLSEILGFNLKEFNQIVDNSNYHVFLNKNKRLIQHPIGLLDSVHKRISKLLSRLNLPDYLHSKKGSSYVSNAAEHIGNVPLIKTDITKFYPNTVFSSIYELFYVKFKCSKDVAWYLARICCYEGRHIPTGSYISGVLAYLTYQDMFDEIYKLSVFHECKMTCYVDDIVLSGPKATKSLLYEVRGIIQKYGMCSKDSKSKTFPANGIKTVTGVIINNEKLKVPNKRLNRIYRARLLLSGIKCEKEKNMTQDMLKGCLQEAGQIESFNK